MNAINFKNVKANSIYNTYKNKPTELEILLNKLNTINSDSIKTDYDLANIAILKSLRNLELKYIKNAVINATIAKKHALLTNNDVVIGNSNFLMALINRQLKAYSKSTESLNQCNYINPVINYQVEYLKAQNYYDEQNYEISNKILINLIPESKNISHFDYLKCLSFLVTNATQNNDDALGLIYALKYDSVLTNTNQASLMQNLMNKNIKYNLSKDESFSSYFVLQKIINSNNIGFLYRKLGDYKNSELYLLQSIANLKKYKNEELFPEITTNIGLTYTHLKRFKEADDYYQKALKKHIDNNNILKQTELNNIIAKNNFLAGNSLIAIKNCETAINLSTSNNDYLNLSNSYFILSEIYAVNSDYQQSQANFKLFTEAKNKYNQYISEQAKLNNNNIFKANLLQLDVEDEISSREKKELEIIKIKLESKQKEQELLLIKKENDIKEKTIKTQALEKEQALKSLELIRGQLEKEKLVKEFDRINKERAFRGLENEKIKTQNKLLNSERSSLLKERQLKDAQAKIDKRTQQFLIYGLIGLGIFLSLISFGFYTNYKQRKVIENTNSQLKVISNNLQLTNSKLEESFSEINEQKKVIEDKNNLVMDSINYSSKIQKSLLLNENQLKEYFNETFVIDMPRDIVGGDFYLIKNKGNKTYVAIVDCTGHGVPGSLISIIGYQEINHIINSYYYSPAQILTQLNTNINNLVNRNSSLGSDGMDVMMLEIDNSTKTLTFSGARSYLLIHNNNEFKEYKGNRISIGEDFENTEIFTNTTIPISESDTIYLYTDGYQDQSGGGNGKRIGSKVLKQTIEKNINNPLHIQKNELLSVFNTHKGTNKQTDDVTILAFKPRFKLENKPSNINSQISELFHKINFNKNNTENLIVLCGIINQEIIISTVRLIETKLLQASYHKNYITKVKIVSTEILQNISKHQQVENHNTTYFIIDDQETQLCFYSGNIVNAKSKEFLIQKLTKYKELDATNLKALYVDTLEKTIITKEGNAGLGLITLASKSNGNFNFDLKKVNDNLYNFNLEVYLKK